MARGKQNRFNQTRKLQAAALGAFLPQVKIDDDHSLIDIAQTTYRLNKFEKSFS